MRKFNPARLYKLSKIIVTIISVLFFIYFVFLLVRYDQASQVRSDLLHKCIPPVPSSICIDLFNKNLQDYENAMKLSALLGIGLPILFYVSITLYRYLFPLPKKR